jgi:flagellar protein FliJ
LRDLAQEALDQATQSTGPGQRKARIARLNSSSPCCSTISDEYRDRSSIITMTGGMESANTWQNYQQFIGTLEQSPLPSTARQLHAVGTRKLDHAADKPVAG